MGCQLNMKTAGTAPAGINAINVATGQFASWRGPDMPIALGSNIALYCAEY